MMNDWGFTGWGIGLGPWFMLLFWVLVIAAIAALFRSLWSRPDHTRGKTAAEIVQERHARVEIDREEFEQKMRDLQGHR
ncbi:MAG: SHOCT domain-containing protein [Ramlibacter sp.]